MIEFKAEIILHAAHHVYISWYILIPQVCFLYHVKLETNLCLKFRHKLHKLPKTKNVCWILFRETCLKLEIYRRFYETNSSNRIQTWYAHKSSRWTPNGSQNAAVCVVAGRVQGNAEGSRLRERYTSAGGRRGSKQSADRRERRRWRWRWWRRRERRGRLLGGCPRLRRLRKGDRRTLVSKGGRSRMALRLPALLSLSGPPGRRAHLLRQGRQHLLQGRLL